MAALSPEQLGALRLTPTAVHQALQRLEIVPHRVPPQLATGLLQSINAAAGRHGIQNELRASSFHTWFIAMITLIGVLIFIKWICRC
jgi:hypothetical protein